MPTHATASPASLLASWPEQARAEWIRRLTPQDATDLEHYWPFWARPQQRAPAGPWRTWFIRAGRGFGKTRSLSEWIRERVDSRKMRCGALVGRTAPDVRDTLIEGVSGILAVFPSHQRPLYEPSKRRVTFYTGAVCHLYSADEPDTLRGPNIDTAGCDELAAWKYPDAWDQLQLTLRSGANPQACIASTPRPTDLVKSILADPETVQTTGSTYDNATNLAPSFLRYVLRKYEGTTLGDQELRAKLLTATPGALWVRAEINTHRRASAPHLVRIVVAVDPAATSGDDADDTGIVVIGIDARGEGYVLEDVTCHLSPDGWARAAVEAYQRHRADAIIGETNNGGEMVGLTIQTVAKSMGVSVNYHSVHASRGKQARAEPVSALAQQGRLHHVGVLAALEDELCTWVPGVTKASPNRLDALVWGATELMLMGSQTADLRLDIGGGDHGDQWRV